MDTTTKTNQAQGQQAQIMAAFAEMQFQQDIPSILEDLEKMLLAAMQADVAEHASFREDMIGTYSTIKRFLKSANVA